MSHSSRWSLTAVIGALGVVYGDIGTSPLYALDATLTVAGRFDSELVLGALSLILWALTISVTIKYVSVIMRADNDGEGGILAMFALAQRQIIAGSLWARVALWLALAGTAFFFCDSLITPAVSVLSAVEGLEVLNPQLKSAVVPVTIGVIVGLFAYQRRGTARIGSLFGPVMVVWFVVIGLTGAAAIRRDPVVLAAVNPLYGIELLTHRPGVALAIIGAVFLAVTGGEALYADMGQFGKEPVRLGWFVLVWPALILNYFGQGALLLAQGKYLPQALYLLVPPPARPWMVILATAATVIASQAVISGAFSMARQAVQLDLLPRIRVLQTSATEQGQIYLPVVNWLVFLAVIAFVVGFGSSEALTGAYGAAVVGTMLVTTILGSFVAVTQWSWSKWSVGSLFGLLMIVDTIFVARQHDQSAEWRLDSTRAGGDPVHGLHDLAQRTAGAAGRARQDGSAASRSAEADRRNVSRPGHRSLSRQRPEHRTFGADPQHRAQWRRARAADHSQCGGDAHAAAGPGAARRDRGIAARRLPGPRALRVHGDTGRR